MDAGGRATQGAVAEDEGQLYRGLPSPLPSPTGRGRKVERTLVVGSVLEVDVYRICTGVSRREKELRRLMVV